MLKLLYWRGLSGIDIWKCASILVFAALHVCVVEAAPDSKKQLDDLRTKIEKLNRDLAKSEESRSEVSDQLKISEKSISEVNLALRALANDQAAINAEIADVNAKIAASKADIARETALRDKLIRQQYMRGDQDALRLLLNGEDVADVERQLTYLGYVGKARNAAITRLRKAVETLAGLEADARQKQTALAENAAAQSKAREMLVAERKERQKVLQRIRVDIDKNRREVGRLKRDETRLTKLVEQIAAEIARRNARQAAERAAREARAAREQRGSSDGGKSANNRNDTGSGNNRIRRPGETVEDVADGGFSGRAFSSLRGKLKLPVRGELQGRFGAQREEGGVTWKGLFIRAEEGQAVRAVADGRVVYADWLRGYGNLLIIDHGDGFLSLYGHNESLGKQVGENVASGEAIASVGSSGGALESGVYFELRQDGKPFDPMRWVGK
jgi:murein hydrolase activator